MCAGRREKERHKRDRKSEKLNCGLFIFLLFLLQVNQTKCRLDSLLLSLFGFVYKSRVQAGLGFYFLLVVYFARSEGFSRAT